jgi:hypothetical protein
MPVASIVISALPAVRSFGVGDAALFSGLLGGTSAAALCGAARRRSAPRGGARRSDIWNPFPMGYVEPRSGVCHSLPAHQIITGDVEYA